MVRIPENSAQRHMKIAPYAEQRGNEMRAAFRTCADNITRCTRGVRIVFSVTRMRSRNSARMNKSDFTNEKIV